MRNRIMNLYNTSLEHFLYVKLITKDRKKTEFTTIVKFALIICRNERILSDTRKN